MASGWVSGAGASRWWLVMGRKAGEGMGAMASMSGHHSTRQTNCEWLTPRHIIDALGPFDLDPCAPEIQPWPTAKKALTKLENGLGQTWTGRVWLNPPYDYTLNLWLMRLADHNNGIALIFARTETAMFFDYVWPIASAVLFFRGRLTFCDVNGKPARGNSGALSVLVAYGENNARKLSRSGIAGQFIRLRGKTS